MNTTHDTTSRMRRVARSRALWITSALTFGSLVLAGCASEASDGVAVSTGSSSTVSTADNAIDTAPSGSTDATTTQETIQDTTAAIEAFLETLSEEQRETVVYDYDDETKTTSWSNFPVTFVERAGLNVAELTDEQQQAAMAVLDALLSDDAYQQVVDIMGGDQYLLENSSSTEESLGQYYIAFFGDASDTDAYAVQFGGHHLGLNADLNGSENSITFAPTHLGMQPLEYTNEDGETVQTFDAIYTDAFAFYGGLTEEQRTTLTSGDVTMCAPGGTCDFESGDGLSGADLTDEQKDLLLELIANWAGMADEESNATTLAEIEATLDDTVIAWSGETAYDTSTGDGISFSISGPNVYVALQAQQGSAGAEVDGVSTSGWGHVHSIYRDPSNDYANSVEQQEAAGGMGGGTPDRGGMPGEPPADGEVPTGAPDGA